MSPNDHLVLTLLPGFDGTGELFGPLQAALDREVVSSVVRYTTERSLDDYVECVARALPAANAALVAESFSGPIALSLLARYPARIRCAVLCATFATSPFRTLTRAAPYVPTALLASTALQRRLLRHFCLNDIQDGDLIDRAAAVIHSLPATTLRNRLQMLAAIDMTAYLPRITVPVLYLQATHDRIVSPQLGRRLIEALPCVTVQDIEGPHLLLQSRPNPCAAAIVRFLSNLQAQNSVH